MSFPELLSNLRKQELQELRAHTDDYFEAVVSMSTLVTVEDVLMSHFGVPVKPAGVSASGEANRYSKPYGGIRKQQTMYYKAKDNGHECAFLWPWGCGTLVTLKVILNESAPSASQSEEKVSWLKSLWQKVFG